MAEETKKKRGRPRKAETKKKSENWGGRREGAGRHKTKENPKTENVTFRVSEKTLAQIRQLRELTKDDEMNFNEMFTQWVDEYASDYGIE